VTRPFCVALTGGIASGKSLAAARFAELGAQVVDTDWIARRLTAPGGAALPAIEAAFGKTALAPDRSLDRAAMRRRVFSDPQARRRLEAILHPLILVEARRAVEASQSPYVLLVVPLLVETGLAYRDLVDRTLVVDCDEADQLRRLMARDALDAEQARAMLAAQASRAERLRQADDVLDNRGAADALLRQVAALHARYLEMSKLRHDSLP